MGEPLLRVEDLRTHIYLDEGIVRAVNGVSFTVDRGQTMALVGESGSGKSVVAQSILRILPDKARIVGGRILFSPDGGRLLDLAALRAVGFPDPERKIDAYPFELSGGLRQRAMIAMAIACRPALLIADEPTSALDVTIQAQILDLLLSLQKEHGMALLIITHDPGVVAYVADAVTVMYCGKVMETGPVATLFEEPRHPYLQALLRSTPHFGLPEGERLQAIAGTVPDPLAPIRGCPFLSRCPEGEPELCGQRMPALTALAPDHLVACYKRGSVPEGEA